MLTREVHELEGLFNGTLLQSHKSPGAVCVFGVYQFSFITQFDNTCIVTL